MGTLGMTASFEPAARAVGWIRRAQRHDGPWYGRWGVNYIYGTWSVLRGLQAIGEDPRQEYIERAVRWLERRQNEDGGWGESCDSYWRPEVAGVGPSIPSQTAWALLGLFAAGVTRGPAVERGIAYLLRTQGADGTWVDSRWNGTGFPRVFFLKYHYYAKYFPLWALGVYRHRAA
jgi:squalene-hopene/tetraprenyl-beta-curcumene cyclase